MTSGQPDYGIPLGERERIFHDVIVPDVLLHSGQQPAPDSEVVIFGGQPGAGKSATAAVLQHDFISRGGLVWVTVDDLRPLHPEYERLLAERPTEMAKITRPAAQWWQDRAAAYLRVGRYNVLLEVGFRDPDAILATAAVFKESDYQVHVAAMAVPAALSRLGIIERYARQVDVTGVGRWTTEASHRADYAGTVEVLRRAQDSPSVDRITVWTRDGLVHDDRRGPDRQWQATTAAADVLGEARGTPLTRLQRVALADRLDRTVQRLEMAGYAHQPLRDMAAEVRQDLEPAETASLTGPGARLEVVELTKAITADLDQVDQTAAARDAAPPEPELPAAPPAGITRVAEPEPDP